MLSMAVRNTRKLIRQKSGAENIRIGRFFTKKDTAALMAELFSLSVTDECRILDPGAGTGILTAALLEAICRQGSVARVYVTAYENAADFLPMLKNNLERLRKKAKREWNVRVVYEIIEENFLLSARSADTTIPYDYIIMNPPHDLFSKDAPELLPFREELTAANTEAAYAFALRCLPLLGPSGQMVTLLPTPCATAVTLTHFRERLFTELKLRHIHLFSGKYDGVRKNMILSMARMPETPHTVTLSISTDNGTREHTHTIPPLAYDFLVDPQDFSLTLVRGEEDLRVLETVRALPMSCADYHLRMRTGLTLESRYRDLLLDKPEKGAVPLIHPRCLSDGRVQFPLPDHHQYLRPSIPSLMQENRNMLLIKRVPAKSDKRRLTCSVYLAAQIPMYRYISTHNKLNYLDTAEGAPEMSSAFVCGLHAVLSSSLYDRYIRIVSKSGQINARELMNFPLPDSRSLEEIGKRLLTFRDYTPDACDAVVSHVLPAFAPYRKKKAAAT